MNDEPEDIKAKLIRIWSVNSFVNSHRVLLSTPAGSFTIDTLRLNVAFGSFCRRTGHGCFSRETELEGRLEIFNAFLKVEYDACLLYGAILMEHLYVKDRVYYLIGEKAVLTLDDIEVAHYMKETEVLLSSMQTGRTGEAKKHE